MSRQENLMALSKADVDEIGAETALSAEME
jgi:hypothetical protein